MRNSKDKMRRRGKGEEKEEREYKERKGGSSKPIDLN